MQSLMDGIVIQSAAATAAGGGSPPRRSSSSITPLNELLASAVAAAAPSSPEYTPAHSARENLGAPYTLNDSEKIISFDALLRRNSLETATAVAAEAAATLSKTSFKEKLLKAIYIKKDTTIATPNVSSISPSSSNQRTIVKAPRFYIENSTITVVDYVNISKLWKLVINNTLPRFYELVALGLIANTDCLRWFYDTFYNNVYTYYPEMHHIFKHNLKIQSKALIKMVANTVEISRKTVFGENVDYKKIFDLHLKMGIEIKEYLIISQLLILTFEECSGTELWNDSIYQSWRAVLSVIVDNLLIFSNTYLYIVGSAAASGGGRAPEKRGFF